MSNYKQDRFDGDATIRNNATIGGNADVSGSIHVDRDLRVGGRLIGGFVNSANMGLFETEADLNSAFPNPKVGMYAQVIVEDSAATATAPTVIKAQVYICKEAGTWTATTRYTNFEITESELEGIYNTYFKKNLDSAISDLDAKSADIVDLADVLNCACASSENTVPCDCCKLPTVKAVFVYTETDGTVLVPHMRTVKIINETGYEDGYYLGFCIKHTAQPEKDQLKDYALFDLSTLKLVGQYTNTSKISVPEWLVDAFDNDEGYASMMAKYNTIIDILNKGTFDYAYKVLTYAEYKVIAHDPKTIYFITDQITDDI